MKSEKVYSQEHLVKTASTVCQHLQVYNRIVLKRHLMTVKAAGCTGKARTLNPSWSNFVQENTLEQNHGTNPSINIQPSLTTIRHNNHSCYPTAPYTLRMTLVSMPESKTSEDTKTSETAVSENEVSTHML